jgi:hypothetical protein
MIALILAAVMLFGFMVACKQHDRRVAGTWYDEDGYKYVFARNGKGSMETGSVTADLKWETHKGVLIMTVSACGMTETREYKYTKTSSSTLELVNVDDEYDTISLSKKKPANDDYYGY